MQISMASMANTHISNIDIKHENTKACVVWWHIVKCASTSLNALGAVHLLWQV